MRCSPANPCRTSTVSSVPSWPGWRSAARERTCQLIISRKNRTRTGNQGCDHCSRHLRGRLRSPLRGDPALHRAQVRPRGGRGSRRGGIRPWLYGIATNLIGRHRRAEVRRYRAMARTGPPPDDEGHDQRIVDRLSASVTVDRLAGALARLSKGERDVVLLIAYGGLSYDEVAAALRIAPGTVASRLNRARTKLHEVLG
ncbi:RNA polymerase sigma factor [Nonomuraea wenchangensis]